ncbi:MULTISPECIES: ATP-dependent helicase HrpB [unclassified Mesorhizobium]|uniref:ATP-dependent helicase HrpB n=2 Tax=Mesorhizobium TaxID=68287 RepID=UPI001092F1E4|nr:MULTISPECIES: ATP-dependent helicase HrpB [unclassified Mesorhizobium]TGQ01713.1 ATP-dependent helicase HrpB [Mesorhizobium sp. M8A.F.Ca.ET.218.01.1.1]TGS37709.1 ATP-dependent helicase HrpB [Mesorhizobium sp. M8A.F.Ca.ET.182.01.1.1]TGS76624.1 ATP-dependent helicase HrpB [Mesorhizobium sp. M8A.F.Ca.ET.181.01.1.1]TGT20986.1 ATP-dependent helicase HrpB [Mesorhizobium sp. M8A.F.Ca.ET.213.01.1.1]
MTTKSLPELPVSAVLPALSEALGSGNSAVLVAPPGAGKTTLVPLALLDAPWLGTGKIVLLEPRRLAARAAARRMAELLGEEPGATVGYAMRMENRTSARTKILVVTEGVLSRMVLDDPELPGVSAIIFDEFHERSLDGDFGLSLALDVQGALRPDLRLLVMSATLDGARVAKLLSGAPVIESQGRAFPVDVSYDERPAGIAIEDAMARAIRAALAEESGSVLAFLPGQREIERTAERLSGQVGADTDIVPLYGQLDGKAQDAAIKPAPAGRRKVVLATSIAETSITIDGVRVVIDSGLSRLPRYEPASGLTRLETVRVSKASADQRAGRAGRTQAGVAIRLWRAEQTAALPAFTPPEILEADLSGLLLDCAAFGVADPTRLAFLDPPPAPALNEARALLRALDAIDEAGRLTEAGASIRKLALPVRLAHMVAEAAGSGHAGEAAMLAVLLTERGLGGDGADLERRLMRFRGEKSPRATSARQLAERLARQVGDAKTSGAVHAGTLLIHAWPDRVAKARGERGRFVLANGSGAMLDAADPLAGEPFLVVADLQGKAQNARITAAAAISEEDIRSALGGKIETRRQTSFDRERRAVRVRETVRLGAITLAERMLPAPVGADADRAILEALREHGLSLLTWSKEAQTLRQRLSWLHKGLGAPWPDMSDETLIERLDDWLLPFLSGAASLAAIDAGVIPAGLSSLVPHDLQRKVDALAPTHFDVPSGSHVPIRYDGEWPVLAVRVQELFGLDRHPSIANGTVPLTLELLSPAHRPIQTTRDLPGFWRGSWADVRADMRGRYPKHVWPENPLLAAATARAKPRGT